MPVMFGSTAVFEEGAVNGGIIDLGDNPNTYVLLYAQLKTAPAVGHQHAAVTLGGVGMVPEGSENLEFNHLHIDRWVLNPSLTGPQALAVDGDTDDWAFLVVVWHDVHGIRDFQSMFDATNTTQFVPVTVAQVRVGDAVNMHALSKQNATRWSFDNGLTEVFEADVGPAGEMMRVAIANKVVTADAVNETFIADATDAHFQKGAFVDVFIGDERPVLGSIGPQTAMVGVPFTGTLVATDDNPGVTYSMVEAPAGSTINPTTGEYSLTFATEGEYEVEFYATDSAVRTILRSSISRLRPWAAIHLRLPRLTPGRRHGR